MHKNTNQVFYQTLHLNQTTEHIIAQIKNSLPPSSKRLIVNDIAINGKNKHICYKKMHFVNVAVNHFNAQKISHIDMIIMHLNKAVDYTKEHIENIQSKSPYFFNQCLYHYDQFKNIKRQTY